MRRFVALTILLALLGSAALAKSIDTTNGNGLVFGTGASSPTTERMRITQSGNVGISNTSPIAKLDVIGTISASDAIQVSGSSLTCSSGIKGAMRYSNTSSTIEYCQGSAWVSMGPSATSVPSFYASKDGNHQTVVANTWTKLSVQTEVFDPHNNFTPCTTNCNSGAQAGGESRFTPAVPGKYLVTAATHCLTPGNYCQMAIYKNGAAYSIGAMAGPGGAVNATGMVTTLVDMNGTTDYLEAYANSQTGTSLYGLGTYSYFTGTLISPYGSGSGGGTATPAGSTGDIQFNTGGALAADTGKLFWDATNNRLGIGTGSPAYDLDVNGFAAATTFLQTSDRRLKDNIRQITSGLAVVEKLNPVTFDWRSDHKPSAGLIAQDLQAVLPNAVVSDSTGSLKVEYNQLLPYVIKGMQELKVANDNLKADNDNLRQVNDRLIKRMDFIERKVMGGQR